MRHWKHQFFLSATSFYLILVLVLEVACVSYLTPDESWTRGHQGIGSNAKAFRSTSGNEKETLIPVNYNVFEPPHTQNGAATKVSLSIIVMNVRDINEKDEQITLEMNLRMFWQDERLNHLASAADNDSFVVLNSNLLDKIWHPDVFIDHAIAVLQPALISKPASLRIYPDSIVRYSARLTVTMACDMNFRMYPVDTQACKIVLKSYAYPNKILDLDWREQKGAMLAYRLDLANFDVELDQSKNRMFTTKTSSGVYSNLEFTITLSRHLSYHLIQTYLPSVIFLIISWLSFLIPKENVTERIGCSMMTLLSLAVMYGSVGQNMPRVSYLTALHVWMAMAIIFVFLALIEFTVVLKLWSLEKLAMVKYTAKLSSKTKLKEHDFQNGNGNGIEMKQDICPSAQVVQDIVVASSSSPSFTTGSTKAKRYEKIAKNLEKITCRVVPCLFLIFNIIYWPWLFIYC